MTTIDIGRRILPYTIYSVFDNVRERTSEKETYMGYPEAIGNVGTAFGGNSVYRKASDKENEKGYGRIRDETGGDQDLSADQ